MKKIKTLRQDLWETFDKLKEGKLDAKDAAMLGSMAGRVLATCRLEMAYNKQTGKPEQIIDFLEQ